MFIQKRSVNKGESFYFDGEEWIDWSEYLDEVELNGSSFETDISDKYTDVYPVDNFSIKVYAVALSENEHEESDFLYYIDSYGNAVVSGDTDGNGIIDTTDYIAIKKHFLNLNSLSGAYFKAADTDGNGVVDTTDYIVIKGFLLGVRDL